MLINDTKKNNKLKNNIIALGAEAAKLKAADNEVINATSGMLKNEDGTLFEFASVKKAANNLSAKDKYAYVDSSEQQVSSKFLGIYKEAVISIKPAQNLVVIKTPEKVMNLFNYMLQ